MIRNIVFDVGKVLVYFEPERHLKNLGYDEETQRIVNNAMFAHPTWNECDRGVLSTEELIQLYISHAPSYAKEIREAFLKVEGAIDLLPHTMDWIKDLKNKGYRLYIISNYGEYTYEQTKEKLAFLPFMDGVIFSYQYKIIKPDLEIYRQLLTEYNLKAEECVFIDDKPENVEAARKVGYYGIQFLDYEQAKQELQLLTK